MIIAVLWVTGADGTRNPSDILTADDVKVALIGHLMTSRWKVGVGTRGALFV